jgi:hypothetical protein
LTAPLDLGGPRQITSELTGQCLDTVFGDVFPKTAVLTHACTGALRQQWLVRYHPSCLDTVNRALACSDVVILNMMSGMCLDVPGGDIKAGLQQYPCNWGNNQRFSIADLSGKRRINSYAAPNLSSVFSPGHDMTVGLSITPDDSSKFNWGGLP